MPGFLLCLSMTKLMARGVPIHIAIAPELYYRDQEPSLLRYLATYYRRCVILNLPSPQMTAVSKIPRHQGPVRVLLIN
jgi:hypothetical protein